MDIDIKKDSRLSKLMKRREKTIVHINDYGQSLDSDGDVDIEKALEWHFDRVNSAIKLVSEEATNERNIK